MFDLQFLLSGAVLLFIVAWFIALAATSGGFFVVIATLLGRELQRGVAENAANDASPILETQSRVVVKRAEISGGENTSTRYYATFEDANGARGEFYLTGQQYGLLAEGDRGVLRSQGTRYLGFIREGMM